MRSSKLADLVLFTMFGVIIFVSDIALEFLPNIHGVALTITVITLVYRARAMYSVLIYLILTALSSFIMTGGYFVFWWVPYIYIFPILWALVMLIPKKASLKSKTILSAVICGFHGLVFGILYSPFWAVMFGLNFEATVTSVIAGFPADILHMCANIAMSTLVYPLYKVLTKLEDNRIKKYQ